MKYALFVAALLLSLQVQAQNEDDLAGPTPERNKVYTTSGGELIFSFGDILNDDVDYSSRLRFSAFLHLGQYLHVDFGHNVGMFTGLAIRNVGMITDEGEGIVRKQRSYALGAPLALKVGDFRKRIFFFTGAEAELMFNYKEKLFVNGDKEDKFNEWFSDRTNLFNPSVFAGIQLPGGWSFKFKYYLREFLNPDFTQEVGGVLVKPYADLDTRLFYVSLSRSFGGKQRIRVSTSDDRSGT
ncbi:MAG TPA: hypothetical protein PKA00_18160 [Saprospiraceae bacterium]|nr:hypothetical protein [Saprospiraceae bacterium]HMQ84843.1 hypothetical protein [Saprospiraceae bacterium]